MVIMDWTSPLMDFEIEDMIESKETSNRKEIKDGLEITKISRTEIARWRVQNIFSWEPEGH